jgi:hypothetical protein
MSRRVALGGAAAAVLGSGALLLGASLDARRACAAYLSAFLFAASAVLGALLLLMIGHVTRARWFVVLRRLNEAVVATLPLVALMFAPLCLGLHLVYPWAQPRRGLPPAVRHAIALRGAWHHPGVVIARSAACLAFWSAVAILLCRWSRRADAHPEEALARRQRTLSAAALPGVFITGTLAAFDWGMSLEPAWHSTAYGVYFLAGGFLSAVALFALSAAAVHRANALPPQVSAGHFGAAGRLLLAAVAFWAYIAFTQFLIVWIADIPDESAFFVHRARGGWGSLSLALAVGQFVLPFFALLFRAVNRRPERLALVAIWLLGMHFLDAAWLVLPSVYPRMNASWIDVAALLAVGGACTAYGAARFVSEAAVPVNDPDLLDSLRYTAS